MAKKVKKIIILGPSELKEFQQYKLSYEKKLMDRDIRDSDTDHVIKIINQSIKVISKATALLTTIFLGYIAMSNYVAHIPIPTEITIGIPISAGFISDIPNSIINSFRKSPP